MSRTSIALAGIAVLAFLGQAEAADTPTTAKPSDVPANAAVATFASGCFWCTESDFEQVPGVFAAVSGYTGGTVADPTYQQVIAGSTGHAEAVQVFYDPVKVSYEHLLDVFWHTSDFLDDGGQFCDRGDQYRSEIYYNNDEQRRLAEASKAQLAEARHSNQPIVTKIVRAEAFYKAEEYHQDYYKKNPLRYKYYRWNCGRDQRLAEIWHSSS
jgi:peptide-methionine (S)-S-oxide reductase